MPSSQDLAFTPATDLRRLIAGKKLSPVELTQLYLDRIHALNSKLNAFLTVADEGACSTNSHNSEQADVSALAQARQAESDVMKGKRLGPLHGIPTSIKDLLPTKGLRTTKGSLILKDWVPDQDDFVVTRIKNAGAIILGKTNTPEFGHGGGVTENKLGDFCRNPWNTKMVAGASSGGAGASVAAGLNPIAHGTDGGGSIRVPASFCGIYGIMGSLGRVPRRNTGPMSFNPVFYSQDGPLTRTVADAALFLQVMAGPHPQASPVGTIMSRPPNFSAALSRGVKGLRIAYSSDLGSIPVEKSVRDVCYKAARVFESLGASVDDNVYKIDIQEVRDLMTTLVGVYDYANYGQYLDKGHLMMPYLREGIENGAKITGLQYAAALAALQRLQLYTRDFFKKYDLLLTPTLAVPPFPCGHRPHVIDGKPVGKMWGFYATLFPFNFTGNPAASVPCGFVDGLPIGLQIVGSLRDEPAVLAASAAFESAQPWSHLRPPTS